MIQVDEIVATENGVVLGDLGNGAYLLSYQDCEHNRTAVFLDWTTAEANYERRVEEAGGYAE